MPAREARAAKLAARDKQESAKARAAVEAGVLVRVKRLCLRRIEDRLCEYQQRIPRLRVDKAVTRARLVGEVAASSAIIPRIEELVAELQTHAHAPCPLNEGYAHRNRIVVDASRLQHRC